MTTTPATDERALFIDWANAEGYDTAHTYDTERSVWIFLNPMTADLRKAWQAARSHPAALAVHEVVEPSHREQVYQSLLRASVGQLKAWHQKYGQHGPSWLPPGGDVNLMETIDDWLNSAAPSKPDAFASAGKPMPGVDGGAQG